MSFRPDSFKSMLNRRGGIATPQRFRVLITGGVLKRSRAEAIALLANRAEIPGRSLATNEIRTNGPHRKMPYVTIYDDLEVGFYCTNDELFPRNLFEEWQNAIVETTTGRINYFDQYVSDIEIEQFDERGDKIFTIKFIDAYPLIVSPMALDWNPSNNYHSLQVTFAYHKWQIQPLPLFPFGGNLAINSLYPNFDIGGMVDKFGVAVVSRGNGQAFSGMKKAGQFLGNLF